MTKISVAANTFSILIGSTTLYLTLRDHHTWFILPFLILELLQIFFLIPILPGRAPLQKIAASPSIIALSFLSVNFWILWNAITLPVQTLPLYQAWGIVSFIGFVLYVSGFILSTWGILTLRLSFSVLPEKRKIVHNGPYRFVKHPIYLGYSLMTIGQSLASGYAALWVGSVLSSLLFIWRASNESKVLYSDQVSANILVS